MSGGTIRVPRERAERIANELVGMLAPACTSITIAGSLRRLRPTIGDIDLVCQPRLIPMLDMFGDPEGPVHNALSELCDAYVDEGQLSKRSDINGRPSWGASLKRAVFRGLNVDIQSVSDPQTLGAWLLIRTGPAEFNKKLVTPRRQGGWLPAGVEFKDGFQLWSWGERVPTPTERSVFEALGLPYREPWDRG